ncbi:MAG: hypothetical protein M2R45_02521 [Verrucomicrobia subdivision 3 bacterium]|nr:hypothetical protein [Limisphaerales bacterium]MCS1414272.1 hypothetical protein [Limisphaerales bacterium]
MILKKLALSITVLALATVSARAQINFEFNFSEPSHFTEPSKVALESAASVVEGLFRNYSATISVEVESMNTRGSTLASAGPVIQPPIFNTPSFDLIGVAGDKILGKRDSNRGGPDGALTVNFYHPWDFDDDIAGNAFDFKSIMIHELLHVVGFSSWITEQGQGYLNRRLGSPDIWAPFDRYVADSTGSIIGRNYRLDVDRWNTASVGGKGTIPPSNGLYFNGPAAMSVFGGNPVPLYSPTEWAGAVVHLDDDFSGTQGMVMNAFSGRGQGIRAVSEVEIGILKDIGYTLIVPEPHEYALITGLALVMFVCVRKRLACTRIA